MSLFMPTISIKSVTELSLETIKSLGIECLLLDVDNTLAEHGSQEPFSGTVEWAKHLVDNGIKIVIVSNNVEGRVSAFASKFNLPFVFFSLKPLPVGFNKARKILNCDKDKILVVGDQIFTDILGANLAGIRSVLLEPKACKETLGIKFRRVLESPIRKKLQNRDNNP